MPHIHIHLYRPIQHRIGDAGYKQSEARAPSGEWTSGGATTRTRTTKSRSFKLPAGTKAKTKAAVTPRVSSSAGMIVAPQDKAQWPEHLRKIRVPPAWTDVHIHPDPKHSLWITGRDVKGRLQPLYSPEHTKTNAAKKFSRVTNLAKNLEKYAARNNKNWNARDKGTKEHAQLLGLMISTGIRPGSERDTGAEKQAYGATTIQGQHVVADEAGNVHLKFVGKKGVDLDLPIEDPAIAKMLQHRAVESGPNGQIFPNVNDGSLRRYVSGITNGQAKPKDFRTLVGTSLAMKTMQTMNKPTNMKEYKKAVKAVATVVSNKLGNTPAIALASYISPQVFDDWKIKA